MNEKVTPTRYAVLSALKGSPAPREEVIKRLAESVTTERGAKSTITRAVNSGDLILESGVLRISEKGRQRLDDAEYDRTGLCQKTMGMDEFLEKSGDPEDLAAAKDMEPKQ